MNKQTRLFAEIKKVSDNDDGTIQVFGVASTEAKDSQDETVTREAMKAALPDYFVNGTGPLRAMHQPIAAGYVSKADVDEQGNTNIEATVVDPVEITKVKTGVYKGFSIGGKTLKGGYDAVKKAITGMRLIEISLVDRPANPGAMISMWKGEDISEVEQEVTIEVNKEALTAVDELAALVNKGEISVQRIVELASAEINKAVTTEVVPPVVEVKEVKKGMYGVSSFASILSAISDLASSAQYEASYENDDSAVPEKLRAWLSSGAEIFQAMATEEVSELVAQLNAAAGVVTTVALAETAEDIEKKGARNSSADQTKIQAMHDHSVDLGADCGSAMDKHDHSADIAKVADLEATITKIEGENVVLKKRVKELEDLPAPSKAVLRVVTKDADIINNTDAVEEDTGPIMKTDGTLDQEATAMREIKKALATGGQRLAR